MNCGNTPRSRLRLHGSAPEPGACCRKCARRPESGEIRAPPRQRGSGWFAHRAPGQIGRRFSTFTPSTAVTATTACTFGRGGPRPSSTRISEAVRSCSSGSCSPCRVGFAGRHRVVRSHAGTRTGSACVAQNVGCRQDQTAPARAGRESDKEARCCTSGSRATCGAHSPSTHPSRSCASPACCRPGAARMRVTTA